MEAPHHASLSLPGLLVVASLASAAPAEAADPLAESLFRAALERMEAGDFEEACPLLEVSHERESKAGTVLLLGSCYEETGRLAKAWATYLEAVAAAEAEGRRSVARRAQGLADAVEPRLGRVVIAVEEPPTRLVVTVDGQVVPRDALGAPFMVDPGARRVFADAPGFDAFTARVTVDAGATVAVAVPPLEPVAIDELPPPWRPSLGHRAGPVELEAATPAAAPEDTMWETGAWIATAAGGALAVAGVAFAIDQQVVAAELDDRCGGPARDRCPPDYDFAGARAREERGQALGIGLGAAGLAGLATAAVLHVMVPTSDEVAPGVSLVPVLAPTAQGGHVTVRW